jgi:hypothetical protein
MDSQHNPTDRPREPATDTTADKGTGKPDFVRTPLGSRFAPGHRQFRQPGSTSRLSIRQQRKLQHATVGKMIAEMAAAQDRHEPVDPVDLTRLIHLHMRLTAEL